LEFGPKLFQINLLTCIRGIPAGDFSSKVQQVLSPDTVGLAIQNTELVDPPPGLQNLTVWVCWRGLGRGRSRIGQNKERGEQEQEQEHSRAGGERELGRSRDIIINLPQETSTSGIAGPLKQKFPDTLKVFEAEVTRSFPLRVPQLSPSSLLLFSLSSSLPFPPLLPKLVPGNFSVKQPFLSTTNNRVGDCHF
jgi:hypothetical protein